MKDKRTTPAIVSLISPNSLWYSGDTKSTSLSKLLLKSSRIITKNETIKIVMRYGFEILRINEEKIAKIPRSNRILSMRCFEIP